MAILTLTFAIEPLILSGDALGGADTGQWATEINIGSNNAAIIAWPLPRYGQALGSNVDVWYASEPLILSGDALGGVDTSQWATEINMSSGDAAIIAWAYTRYGQATGAPTLLTFWG